MKYTTILLNRKMSRNTTKMEIQVVDSRINILNPLRNEFTRNPRSARTTEKKTTPNRWKSSQNKPKHRHHLARKFLKKEKKNLHRWKKKEKKPATLDSQISSIKSSSMDPPQSRLSLSRGKTRINSRAYVLLLCACCTLSCAHAFAGDSHRRYIIGGPPADLSCSR